MCCILFLGLVLPVFALGRGDKEASSPSVPVPGAPVSGGDWVELEGRLRLVGSEPFTELVLTGADGQDWYLEGPARRALQVYEQRSVRVRGKVELREMLLANGRSLGLRRVLSEITLLE